MADLLKRYKAKFTRDGRGEGVFSSPPPPHRQVWLGLMKNKDSELKYFAINDMGSLKNVLINVTFHSFYSIQILRLCSIKGYRGSKHNYHPVSILPIIPKIFGKLLSKQISMKIL